jgi:hypothetical protein
MGCMGFIGSMGFMGSIGFIGSIAGSLIGKTASLEPSRSVGVGPGRLAL